MAKRQSGGQYLAKVPISRISRAELFTGPLPFSARNEPLDLTKDEKNEFKKKAFMRIMVVQGKGLPAVRACLFDMDGLLIDTEDLYTKITNIILSKYNRPNLPWHIKAQLQGRPSNESSKIFLEWANLPIPPSEFYAEQSALQAALFPTTRPLPGVQQLLASLAATTSTLHPVHIALATSSTTRNYELKSTDLKSLFALFPESQLVCGDDPRMPRGRGKPLPDIYHLALETINSSIRAQHNGSAESEISPAECLVFEDSVPGVEAARRAGMQVVWVPHPGLAYEYRGREPVVLAGLTGEHREEDLPHVHEDEAVFQANPWRPRDVGCPGSVGDGWGVQLETLEEFPYGRYGIVVPEGVQVPEIPPPRKGVEESALAPATVLAN